ncbi:MAG: hypothetical protein QXI19_04745 [Candidatus Caldarchaeum sp.]
MRTWIVMLLGAIVLNILVGIAGCSKPEPPPEATKIGEDNPAKTGEAKVEQTQ